MGYGGISRGESSCTHQQQQKQQLGYLDVGVELGCLIMEHLELPRHNLYEACSYRSFNTNH